MKYKLVCLLTYVSTGFPDGAVVKNPPGNAGDKKMQVQSQGREDPLEKAIATHSSILAWEIPCTEDPGGRQFMGLRRVGHD